MRLPDIYAPRGKERDRELSAAEDDLLITLFRSVREPQGQRVATSWAKFTGWSWDPLLRRDKYDAPLFSLARFANDYRRQAGVQMAVGVVLDLDHGNVAPEHISKAFRGIRFFAYSTHSSRPEARRWRIVAPSRDEIRPCEYAPVARGLMHSSGLPKEVFDSSCAEVERAYFLPAISSPDAEFLAVEGEGEPFDPVAMAALAPPVERPRPPLVAKRVRATWEQEPTGAPVEDRARAFLRTISPAVSGDHGHTVTFLAAAALVRGFSLSEQTAFDLLSSDFNPRCVPPWSDLELRRKVREAARSSRMDQGYFLRRGGR